jgi:hypothetical protein
MRIAPQLYDSIKHDDRRAGGRQLRPTHFLLTAQSADLKIFAGNFGRIAARPVIAAP